MTLAVSAPAQAQPAPASTSPSYSSSTKWGWPEKLAPRAWGESRVAARGAIRGRASSFLLRGTPAVLLRQSPYWHQSGFALVSARVRERAALSYLIWHHTPVETEHRRWALKRRAPDPWLGFDKAQHAAFSFLLTLGNQYTLVNKIDVSERRALPVSMTGTAVVGLAKEVYDRRWGRRRHFSYRDLVADAVGIVLAAGLIVL